MRALRSGSIRVSCLAAPDRDLACFCGNIQAAIARDVYVFLCLAATCPETRPDEVYGGDKCRDFVAIPRARAHYYQRYLAKNANGYCGIGGCEVPFKIAELQEGQKPEAAK